MKKNKPYYHIKRWKNSEIWILESHVLGPGMFGRPTVFANYVCEGSFEYCKEQKEKLEKLDESSGRE